MYTLKLAQTKNIISLFLLCVLMPTTLLAQISNTATVSADGREDASATAVTTIISPASLSATKTASGHFFAGGTVTYTIVITNSSASAQLDNPGNEFIDQLPPQLDVLSAAATSGSATIDSVQNTVSWNGSIPGNSSVNITIDARINLLSEGVTITNQASLNFDADGDGSNESSATTDDPNQGGPNDATSFTGLAALVIPALNGFGLSLLGFFLILGVLLTQSSRVSSRPNK